MPATDPCGPDTIALRLATLICNKAARRPDGKVQAGRHQCTPLRCAPALCTHSGKSFDRSSLSVHPRLGIAVCDGSLSFGPGQGSLGGKSGTSEQRGEQDTKHKAHDVIPSLLSDIPTRPRTEETDCGYDRFGEGTQAKETPLYRIKRAL